MTFWKNKCCNLRIGSLLQGNEEGKNKKKNTCKFLRVGHWDCGREMKIKRKWEGHFVVGENMISSVMERKKIEILK